MTSSRQRRDRPIQSVELKILIEAGGASKKVAEAVPGGKVVAKGYELTIRGEDPKAVEAKAREAMERLRKAGMG